MRHDMPTMDVKDYYVALGVAPDADEKTIKQAYRRLARQYHPDTNNNDPAAAERFKAINEAYQTLGDPDKRRRYDELRQQYQQWQQYGRRGSAWQEWHPTQGGQAGYSYRQTITPEMWEELFSNGDIFGDLFGRQERTPRPRRGRDLESEVQISLTEAYHGTRRSIQIGDRRLEVRIPPGVQSGARIRLSGQGSVGEAGGAAGDLYLLVQISPDSRFVRDGDDLTTTIDVDIYTAVVGGEVCVPSLDGATLKLKLPPRTDAGTRFRLRGKGMPRFEQPEQRGDLYAQVRIVLPDHLSDDELATLQALQQARQRA